MKKTYTFEVQRRIQWPKTRCPECGNGWIETWHLIHNGNTYGCTDQSFDPAPYNGEWQVRCPLCGLTTVTFHSRKNARKAWKDLCKGE